MLTFALRTKEKKEITMATITEDYVSFETAKLLKEKGFQAKCTACYRSDLNNTFELISGRINYCNPRFSKYKSIPPYNAPTHQMALKWLREVQALNIYVRGVWKDVEVQYGDWELAVVGYEWFVESLTDDTYSKMSVEQFLTYEEACEAAIKYCLENLI